MFRPSKHESNNIPPTVRVAGGIFGSVCVRGDRSARNFVPIDAFHNGDNIGVISSILDNLVYGRVASQGERGCGKRTGGQV